MKKLKLIVVIAVLVALLGGCAFITGLFGPGKNNILDWIAGFADGTRYTFQERNTTTDPSYSDTTYDYQIEVVDVDARETKTVVRILFDGEDHYLIADDAREQLVFSFNDFIDDSDQIILETPVEEGTTWVGPLSSYVLYWLGTVEDVRFTIDRVDGTRDAGAETPTDVVVIRVQFPTGFWAEGVVVTTAEIYLSPTFGWLGDRYVLTQGGYTFTYETVVTDIDMP